MHLSLTPLMLLLAPSCALLQVHTRLAKAILHKAKVDAMQQREALLAQAELLFAAAADIDDALARLERGEAMAEPPVVTRTAPPPPEAPAETALRRLGGRVVRVVDFAGDAAATAPLDVARAVALDAVHVLGVWVGELEEEPLAALLLLRAHERASATSRALSDGRVVAAGVRGRVGG